MGGDAGGQMIGQRVHPQRALRPGPEQQLQGRVLPPPPGQDTAQKFIAFVASADGQKLISDYGRERFGEALYNDEVYARQYDK